MRPHIEQSNGLASLSPFQSWPDCTTNTSGYDFRKGQDGGTAHEAAKARLSNVAADATRLSCVKTKQLTRGGPIDGYFQRQSNPTRSAI